MQLKIYQAPSGQWSGVIIENGEDVARIAGCESPEEVEESALEQWPEIQIIEAA